MIIGLVLICPLGVQAESKLPDPVAFAVNMELGDLGRAQAWLDAGLPPDFMGSRIGTGLMIGAWEGNLDLMKLFLERGADINRVNDNGESALALAAWRGQKAAVDWLLARGAKLNPGNRRWSALHYAAFTGNDTLLDELIAQGADINARAPNGSTPLMMAVYEGKEDIAKKLLDKGAQTQVKNDWGDGALEWAMRYNRLNIARLVSNAEEFNAAVSRPRESWGEPAKSMSNSRELDQLLSMREKLVARGMAPDSIDRRIAAERMRIAKAEMERAPAKRAPSLEISASRQKPQAQSAQVVYDENGKAMFKAPPATYFGAPKMPAKGPVKNY